MADFVIMPRQGQSVESCILTEIYKKKGDKVSAGDLLFAYETDKASFEEESQFEGIVLDVFFSEGDEIPVLSNVMVIGAEGESVGQLYQESGKETVSKETETSEIIKETPKNTEQQQTTIDANAYRRGDGDESFVSPRAKMLAEEKGVDVSLLTGTGPAGRIIERDVQQAAADSKLSPLAKKKLLHESTLKAGQGTGLDGTVIGRDLLKKGDLTGSGFEIKPLSNMRKLIARAMHESLQNSAQLTHHLGADARNILA
ncbi:MAG: E3 binding domain-containing protein, partial [Prolixibacteraceae bacterium]|nr:E3 binding domain-containing protein [Prolixibacteraceae bacterium]